MGRFPVIKHLITIADVGVERGDELDGEEEAEGGHRGRRPLRRHHLLGRLPLGDLLLCVAALWLDSRRRARNSGGALVELGHRGKTVGE